MKNTTLRIAAVGLFAASSLNAAILTYDLQADWSSTQNPNGVWSYRQGENLLVNDPLAWVGQGYVGDIASWEQGPVSAMEKVNGLVKIYGASLSWVQSYDGFLADGDVVLVPGVGGNVLWTAPAAGKITISGGAWVTDPWFLCADHPMSGWTLEHNGTTLSSGAVIDSCASPRTSPQDFGLGVAGPAALQNVTVAAGDQIVLRFSGTAVGLHYAITFTPDSVDPVTAIENLAINVVQMNLQNGIANSLDAKLDAALSVLTDVNLKNDGAACNSLASFINAVQAQRGKKISNAQADQLIASARDIESILQCAN